MRLETPRFQLRPLGVNSVPQNYYSWLKDREITRYLEIYSREYQKEDAEAYIRGHDNQSSFFFGIYTKEDRFIGTHSVKGSFETSRFSVGGLIGVREFWGQNVIIETRGALLDFMFFKLGLTKAESGCYSGNYPTIYNCLRQGWKKEGVLRAHRTIDGIAEDLILFGLLKDEWGKSDRS